MGSMADAKKDMAFNQELTDLIGVIKGIAASQFRSLEAGKKERFVKFTESFEGFFEIIHFVDTGGDAFTRVLSEVTGIIIITSDEGFMGGLNARVIHAALEKAGSNGKKIAVIGEQGANYLRDLGETYTAFPGVVHEQRYELAVKLKDFIVDQVLKKEMGRVFVAYPKPVSLTFQTVEVVRLLPFMAQSPAGEERKVIVESSFGDILDYLVKIWITHKLYDIFEDSKLSEFSARMMHLEESGEELSRQGEALRYRYFRSYHEMVDKGMREIFASKLLSRKT